MAQVRALYSPRCVARFYYRRYRSAA